jgi:hypothetical protein
LRLSWMRLQPSVTSGLLSAKYAGVGTNHLTVSHEFRESKTTETAVDGSRASRRLSLGYVSLT